MVSSNMSGGIPTDLGDELSTSGVLALCKVRNDESESMTHIYDILLDLKVSE